MANAFCQAAISRRDVIASLIVLVPIPAVGKEPAPKAFLDEIYRHYANATFLCWLVRGLASDGSISCTPLGTRDPKDRIRHPPTSATCHL
jgi:hypothetical protein